MQRNTGSRELNRRATQPLLQKTETVKNSTPVASVGSVLRHCKLLLRS